MIWNSTQVEFDFWNILSISYEFVNICWKGLYEFVASSFLYE